MHETENNMIIVFKELLAQLSYPVYRMKLMAAKKIAEILSGDNNGFYQRTFLEWVSERDYETEIITALTVLGLVEKEKLIAYSVLKEFIKKPSILSEVYIKKIYDIDSKELDWANQHSGIPPSNFKVPDHFENICRYNIAPVFMFDLKKLDKFCNLGLLDFWAWEYQNLETLLGEFGSIEYFLESDDRLEHTGSYHSKISDALQSAYLRMLHCIIENYNMPMDLAIDLAFNAATLDFKLSKVSNSIKPKELEDNKGSYFGVNITSQEVSNYINQINSKFDEVLISASFPLHRSKNYAADLDLISVISNRELLEFSGQSFFDDQSIFMPKKYDFHDLQNQSAAFEAMEDISWEEGGLLAAFKILPLGLKRWQIEIIMRGLFVPSPLLVGGRVKIEYAEDQVLFKIGDNLVARWLYWMDNWNPSYLRGVYSGVGTALFVKRDIIENNINKKNLALHSVIKLNSIRREKDYGSYESNELYSILNITPNCPL